MLETSDSQIQQKHFLIILQFFVVTVIDVAMMSVLSYRCQGCHIAARSAARLKSICGQIRSLTAKFSAQFFMQLNIGLYCSICVFSKYLPELTYIFVVSRSIIVKIKSLENGINSAICDVRDVKWSVHKKRRYLLY